MFFRKIFPKIHVCHLRGAGTGIREGPSKTFKPVLPKHIPRPPFSWPPITTIPGWNCKPDVLVLSWGRFKTRYTPKLVEGNPKPVLWTSKNSGLPEFFQKSTTTAIGKSKRTESKDRFWYKLTRYFHRPPPAFYACSSGCFCLIKHFKTLCFGERRKSCHLNACTILHSFNSKISMEACQWSVF